MKSLKNVSKLAGKVMKSGAKGAGTVMKGMVKGMPGKSLKGRRPMLGGKKGTR